MKNYLSEQQLNVWQQDGCLKVGDYFTESQKKELLAEYEPESIGQGAQLKSALDGMHFPLRARHFFKPCAEGPCANGEIMVT